MNTDFAAFTPISIYYDFTRFSHIERLFFPYFTSEVEDSFLNVYDSGEALEFTLLIKINYK